MVYTKSYLFAAMSGNGGSDALSIAANAIAAQLLAGDPHVHVIVGSFESDLTLVRNGHGGPQWIAF